jgi:hypothetical protein
MSSGYQKLSTSIWQSLQPQNSFSDSKPVKPSNSEALFINSESNLIAIGPDSKYIILSQADITHCIQKIEIFMRKASSFKKKFNGHLFGLFLPSG